MHQRNKKADRPVIALSFHVDYSNRLGWADPFSGKVYSQRQSELAKRYLILLHDFDLTLLNALQNSIAVKKIISHEA
ncbi:MAG: DUF1223 domain-containing protein [Saprospiraceae bacterium]|nr:DUF1223 domain-containing protein [Saprospiraceae bacterium]MBK8563036.1 DUF1223 domain-containing protein [Saprospiraceae bacterium]